MTMIGPASPKQICPECEGEGCQYHGEQMEYRPGWPNPASGKWVSVPVIVECDFCGGSGRVTKATIKWYNEQAS